MSFNADQIYDIVTYIVILVLCRMLQKTRSSTSYNVFGIVFVFTLSEKEQHACQCTFSNQQ